MSLREPAPAPVNDTESPPVLAATPTDPATATDLIFASWEFAAIVRLPFVSAVE